MIGQTISHYRIVEKLGEGGMGVVYKAEDSKLGRAVALKFLPADLLESEEHKVRFLHEARAAAMLDHPNICTVYEIDEADGKTFLAMACLEGQTLKQKIAARPLPLKEALDIAIQIGQGLQAAHEKGIVHRDIKPANIMINRHEQVKLMDFGLAQHSDRTQLTASGMKVGTPAYMSPEQAEGKPADRRSDIWSLGVVVYEMISGRVPFSGEAEAAVAHAILYSDPEPPTALRSGLPISLDRVLTKALAKNAADRYQHVEDLLVDLHAIRNTISANAVVASGGRTATAKVSRYPIAGAAALLLIAGWLGWTWLRPSPPSGVRSLAILPFRLLSTPSADNHLGLGMADSIIAKVSQVPGLTVRPTSAVSKYSTADTDALSAAQALGVDAVLDGNLQRASDRLRVSVNLLDAATGASLWADTFNVANADIFAVQDEVSLRVVSQLRYRISASQQARLIRRYTSNPLAYEYYQKAMRIFERRDTTMPTADLESAIALFQKAVEADPGYALARSQLAYAYVWMGLFRDPENPAWIERGRDEVGKAESLDSELAETHIVRGDILFSIHGGFRIEGAIREARRAQQLNPSVGHGEIGIWYAHLGLDEASGRELARALEIDPLSEVIQRFAVERLSVLARHREALVEHQRLFNRPGRPDSLMALGRLDEAEPLVEAAFAANPRSPKPLGDWVLLRALRGQFALAESKVSAIQSAARDRSFHHGSYSVAQVYALQGKSGEAVQWLRATADTGMPIYPVFARDPLLSRIRETSDYDVFMRELKVRWEKLVGEIEQGTATP